MSDDWLRDAYDKADGLDAAGWAALFEDAAPFTMGNNPAMVGPAEIEAGLEGFFGGIGGMHHDFTNRVTVGNTEFVEAKVTYTRLDGSTVTVPGAAIIELNGSKIAAARSYVDIMPLFATEVAQ